LYLVGSTAKVHPQILMVRWCVFEKGREIVNNEECQDPATAESRIWVIALLNVLIWVVWQTFGTAELAQGKTKLVLSGGGALMCFLMVSLA
jgi:hypothetical protein